MTLLNAFFLIEKPVHRSVHFSLKENNLKKKVKSSGSDNSAKICNLVELTVLIQICSLLKIPFWNLDHFEGDWNILRGFSVEMV